MLLLKKFQSILMYIFNYSLLLRGHSTTTWIKFYPILTPTPLEWTKMDILHTIYPSYVTPCGLYSDPNPPLLVHVVIECSITQQRNIRHLQLLLVSLSPYMIPQHPTTRQLDIAQLYQHVQLGCPDFSKRIYF